MANNLQNKFGGVNERVLPTDSIDFSSLNGVWPRSAGIQTRIEGKGLLAKYPNPVWSIYQFWNPFGYGIALLQFPNKLTIEPWINDPWNINLIDGGTIDTTFDISITNNGDNINLGTDWKVNGDNNTKSGLPEGRNCKLKTVPTDYSIASLIDTIEIATGTYSNEIYHDFAPPYPTGRVPLNNFAPLGGYSDVLPNSLLAIRNRSSARFFSPGPYPHDFTVSDQQFSDTTNRRGVLNLSFLFGSNVDHVTLVGSDMREYPLTVDFDINDEAFISVDPSTFIMDSDIVLNGSNGYSQGTTLIFSTLRVYSIRRVCT